MNRVERGALQQQRVLTFNDFLPMQQKEAKMDACMLLHVLITPKRSINTSSRFSSVHARYQNTFSWVSIEEMRRNDAVMDQRSCVNVNVGCCCCLLLIFNKVECCHCIQNYLIALATATPCPNTASCRSCIHLSIFVSTYCAVVSGRKRSFSMGKELSWNAVHALAVWGRQSGGV